MFVDSQVKNALASGKSKIAVLVTCSGHADRVEAVLTQLGVEVTGGIPEFLLLNANITEQQLTALDDVKGIGSIELDQEQQAI